MNNQSRLFSALTSQVGRKVLTGITGVLLVLYLIAHISGNLSLLGNDPTAFNKYGAFLHGFGKLFYLVEIGLGVTILLHAYIGITIWMRKRAARKQGYAVHGSKGAPSKQSISSRTMIITGTVMLVFITVHVLQFRFGPGEAEGYVQTLSDGTKIHDLRRITVETFSHIGWVVFYVGAVLLLGFHLRHGIWSMLQSLGAMKPRASGTIYALAFILAIILAAAFIFLPIWIHFQGGAA
ncbi:MAG: succinate dehydrogenase cytochrome b subunit [Bacteroidetes bacterium]|nr:succinate dehydrogenase cytochrome b subunit [Bacteroidota bacterium]